MDSGQCKQGESYDLRGLTFLEFPTPNFLLNVYSDNTKKDPTLKEVDKKEIDVPLVCMHS